MKRLVLTVAVTVLLMGTAFHAVADDDEYERRGGYGYGHGPGMMGPGYGPGMMGPGYGYGPGPGMMGPGYGYGPGPGMMGPGMMGPGFGPGMMGPGYGFGPGMMYGFAELSPEQRRALQDAHTGMMQAMLPKVAEMQQHRLALGEALRQYPADKEAAREAHAALNKARDELFELRLEMMSRVQEIVGEELWQRMHSGGYGSGYGPGYGPGGGPGMMGPRR